MNISKEMTREVDLIVSSIPYGAGVYHSIRQFFEQSNTNYFDYRIAYSLKGYESDIQEIVEIIPEVQVILVDFNDSDSSINEMLEIVRLLRAIVPKNIRLVVGTHGIIEFFPDDMKNTFNHIIIS